MPTIDSDAHVVETEHTWDFMERADQKYRPLIVRPRGEGGGEYWFIDGKIRGLVRIVMTARELAEVSERTGRDMQTPRETREMENVPARLKHMDELGIDVQVLYPTIFIEQITDKVEWEIAIAKGYNRWLADIYRQGQGRLRWICVLPLLDMSASIEELKFCQQHGACGVFMRGIEGQRLITDPYFYPLYEEISALDLAVGVHVGNGNPQRDRSGVAVQRRRQLLEVSHSRHRRFSFGDHERGAKLVPQASVSLGRSRRAVDTLCGEGFAAPLGNAGKEITGKSDEGIPAVCFLPDGRRRGLHPAVLGRR